MTTGEKEEENHTRNRRGDAVRSPGPKREANARHGPRRVVKRIMYVHDVYVCVRNATCAQRAHSRYVRHNFRIGLFVRLDFTPRRRLPDETTRSRVRRVFPFTECLVCAPCTRPRRRRRLSRRRCARVLHDVAARRTPEIRAFRRLPVDFHRGPPAEIRRQASDESADSARSKQNTGFGGPSRAADQRFLSGVARVRVTVRKREARRTKSGPIRTRLCGAGNYKCFDRFPTFFSFFVFIQSALRKITDVLRYVYKSVFFF